MASKTDVPWGAHLGHNVFHLRFISKTCAPNLRQSVQASFPSEKMVHCCCKNEELEASPFWPQTDVLWGAH